MRAISGAIIAKNEAKYIEHAIASMKDLCDEILVIDNESSDDTAKVAKACGARVISSSIRGDFSGLRNLALHEAKHDFVLYLDGDEALNDRAIESIIQVKKSARDGVNYALRRHDIFWGKELTRGELSSVATQGIVRLISRGSGTFSGRVHEKFITTHDVVLLDGAIVHHAHDSIASFVNTVNEYSSIRADELFRLGVRVSLFSIIVYPIGKFIYTYFLKGGYADGPQGFVYSFLMSFHSFLVRSKLFLMYQS